MLLTRDREPWHRRSQRAAARTHGPCLRAARDRPGRDCVRPEAVPAASRADPSACRRLLAEGVSAFHFYTLNQAPLCTAVCRMLGAQPGLEEAA